MKNRPAMWRMCSSPAAKRARSAIRSRRKRIGWHRPHTTPAFSPAATTRSALASDMAIGISISTCLPAAKQASACSSCCSLGVARMTTSIAGSASASSSEVVQRR